MKKIKLFEEFLNEASGSNFEIVIVENIEGAKPQDFVVTEEQYNKLIELSDAPGYSVFTVDIYADDSDKELTPVEKINAFIGKMNKSLYLQEGVMSEIDIIGQEAETAEDFKAEVKKLLKQRAADPKVADDEEYLNTLSKTYFDEEGNKI